MSRVILQDNPNLNEVKKQHQAFESKYGAAAIYYNGTVYSLEEEDANEEYSFPGALHVGAVLDDSFTLLILDDLYEWSVEPAKPYAFEFVTDGVAPTRPVYEIPADELWPDWSTSIRELASSLSLPALPSTEEYKQALTAIHKYISDGQIAMLRTQYLAPNHKATATELAQAAKYKNFRGTNLQYGKLGQTLRDALNYHDDQGQVSYVLSYFIQPGTEDNEDWLFVMHPEVAQALKELEWFKHWE